jgi:hypothetical protein
VPGIHVLLHFSQEKRGWPDKPGHDERAGHFQAVRKSVKTLDAFASYPDVVLHDRLSPGFGGMVMKPPQAKVCPTAGNFP